MGPDYSLAVVTAGDYSLVEEGVEGVEGAEHALAAAVEEGAEEGAEHALAAAAVEEVEEEAVVEEAAALAPLLVRNKLFRWDNIQLPHWFHEHSRFYRNIYSRQ